MDNWGPGYSRAELDVAQEKYGLRFPPDLLELLSERRPPGGWDWTGPEDAIREILVQPLDGIIYDVEANGLWWPEWGERPDRAEQRAEVVTTVVAAAPTLIPIFAHRYIPEEPHEPGNPVFSVSQSDIIYYGADLEDYFRNELSVPHSYEIRRAPRHIRFWSEMVERAWDPAFYR